MILCPNDIPDVYFYKRVNLLNNIWDQDVVFLYLPTYLNISIVLFNCKIHYKLQRLATFIILIHMIY